MKFDKKYNQLVNENILDEGIKSKAMAWAAAVALGGAPVGKGAEVIKDKTEQTAKATKPLNMPKLVQVLKYVESGNDVNVKPGDGGKAVGILQMHPIMVREINRISGRNYSLEDRNDAKKSTEMANIFLSYIKKRHFDRFKEQPTPERLGAYWKGGKLRKTKDPKYPKYMARVKKLYHQ